MADESFPEDVFALLEDQCARTILEATSEKSMPAASIVDTCSASRATVYRRIDQLNELDLLNENLEPDGNGHHHRVYSSSFRRLTVELIDGEFHVRSESDPADKLTLFWEEL